MSIYEEKGIQPMLISEQQNPFNSPDWIYELKLDGIRCIAYMDYHHVDLRNKRDKKLLPFVPELSEIHRQVTDKCILDGELFVLKNGITDFYEIQRRALMTDPFKIKLAGQKYPTCFVAFDILYLKNKLMTDSPLIMRKDQLKKIVVENNFFCASRYVENDGIKLFKAAKSQYLEGIVAKKKDSQYYFGKRTKDWIKCKVMQTDDCVICGYIPKTNHMTSLILGQYDDNHSLVYRGHVTLGVSLRFFDHYRPKRIDFSPFGSIPKGNENAIWLAPELVCIVESMPTDKKAFRQPVFKGIRDDKLPKECRISPEISMT